MNIHIDADGGLVSNPSDREIQGTSDFATRAAALVSDVSTLSWNEPRIAKRDIGHLSNMKLNDPSTSEVSIPAYIGKSTFFLAFGNPFELLDPQTTETLMLT